MLQFILKLIREIFLKKLKKDFSVDDFESLKYTALRYTLKFQCLLISIWGLYELLRQKKNEYILPRFDSDDIPPEIGVLLNKSYNDITWDQINKAKEFLKNKDIRPKQDIKVIELIKPERLIRLEFYLKIAHLFLLIPTFIIIIIILLRNPIKSRIKKIINYLWVLLNNTIMFFFEKKNRKGIIIITSLTIINKIVIFIIEYILYN